LRLICPVIVSPHKFADSTMQVPAHTQRTLVLFSKVIQRLANHTTFDGALEAHMEPFNQLINKNLLEWEELFFRLLGRKHLIVNRKTGVPEFSKEFVDDIVSAMVARSAENIGSREREKCSPLLVQQTQDLETLLTLEKRSDFEIMKRENFDLYWKPFEGSTAAAVMKLVSRNLKVDYRRLFEFVAAGGLTKLNPNIEDHRLIEHYTDNLSIECQTFRMSFGRREMVALKYSEILPIGRLGIVCWRSIKRDDIPVKYTRIKIFSGFIVRETNPGETQVSLIIHADSKGIVKYLPRGLLRKALKKQFSFYSQAFALMEKDLGSVE